LTVLEEVNKQQKQPRLLFFFATRKT